MAFFSEICHHSVILTLSFIAFGIFFFFAFSKHLNTYKLLASASCVEMLHRLSTNGVVRITLFLSSIFTTSLQPTE